MKALLAVICPLTLLATAYLSLSLVILHPPRANYVQWFLMAVLFIAQAALTLAAIAGAVSVSGGLIRWVLVAGGAAVTFVGALWLRATLSGVHFEGYALVLGSMLVVQGVLTVCAFWSVRSLGLTL
jgi:hypothetical protein